MNFFKNKPMIAPINIGIKTKLKNPLDKIPLKGNIEEDSIVELTELQKAFQDRSKHENDRFKLSTDSEYWCCLCFSSREQKEHFLSKMGLLEIGDKYLDGYKVAKKLNIKLPEVKFQKID